MRRTMAVVMGLVGVAVAALSQSGGGATRVTQGMVAYPPVQFAAVMMLTPGGSLLAQLGEGIVLDTSGAVPVLRAVTPAAVPVDTVEVFAAAAGPQMAFTIGADAAGGQVKVWRNGLRMAPGVDYTVAGRVVTFTAEQGMDEGGRVLVEYRGMP